MSMTLIYLALSSFKIFYTSRCHFIFRKKPAVTDHDWDETAATPASWRERLVAQSTCRELLPPSRRQLYS